MNLERDIGVCTKVIVNLTSANQAHSVRFRLGPYFSLSHSFTASEMALVIQNNVLQINLLSFKGQITSKGLFGILGFFQITNEQIRFLYC